MLRRVFVALPISTAFQNEILEWERRHSRIPARWLEGKNLHVTLLPPWYEEDIESVAAKLREITGAGQFEMRFTRVKYGPDERNPRLVWAEGESIKEASALKEELEYVMRARSEYRPWKMHLTLARFREEDFSMFPVKKLDEQVRWSDIATEFVLMESYLSRSEADYKILESFPLK